MCANFGYLFLLCLLAANNMFLLVQILDPYEVTPDKFAQLQAALFARVNAV